MLRFVLPFLFVRNWHTGAWELSRARVIIFSALGVLFLLGILIAYILQMPVEYQRPAV